MMLGIGKKGFGDAFFIGLAKAFGNTAKTTMIKGKNIHQ
jgi:hypothetical protein